MKYPVFLFKCLAFVLLFYTGCSDVKNNSATEHAGIQAETLSYFEQNFITKFKTIKLPYKSSPELYGPYDSIPPDDAIRYIIEPCYNKSKIYFEDVWNENSREDSKIALYVKDYNENMRHLMAWRFYYVGKINIYKDINSVLVLSKPVYMEGGGSTMFLLNFDEEGTMLDAKKVADYFAYVGLETVMGCQITKDGKIAVNAKKTTFDLYGNREKTQNLAEIIYQANEDGNISVIEESYQTFAGKFEDTKSRELIDVFEYDNEMAVYYRKNREESIEAAQQMEVLSKDALTGDINLSFLNSSGKYTFQYNKERNKFTCTNPDGSIQSFERIAL